MIYITFIVLCSMVLLLVIVYNNSVRNQNEIIMKDNREYDEDTPYKKFLPKVTPNVIWVYVIGLFVLFIASRISLCGLSETEFKSIDVIIPSEELTIDKNNNTFLIYVDNKLKEFDLNSMDVIIDNSITSPQIKNYYSRTIKLPVNNPNMFFLYNRKEKKIGEWEETYQSCGCGGNGDLTLVLPNEYSIKQK